MSISRRVLHKEIGYLSSQEICLYLFHIETRLTVIRSLFYTLILLLPVSVNVLCQERLRLEQLPVSAQNHFKQIAAKYRTGMIDQRAVENDLKVSGIDFSNMPIEDAVMLLFQLIADDARKDMKDQLEEMNAARQHRAAIRQSIDRLKKETDSLKNQTRFKTRRDSLSVKTKLNEKTIQLQRFNNQEQEAIAAENKAINDRNAAEKHLWSVEQALSNMKNNLAPVKRQ